PALTCQLCLDMLRPLGSFDPVEFCLRERDLIQCTISRGAVTDEAQHPCIFQSWTASVDGHVSRCSSRIVCEASCRRVTGLYCPLSIPPPCSPSSEGWTYFSSYQAS